MNIIHKDLAMIDFPALIIHGVNCQRVMRSGVAKALYMRWPQVLDNYLGFSKQEMVLGKISTVQVDDELLIINCWTQIDYGYDGKQYATVESIKKCLTQVIRIAKELNILNIYSPKIGCGLGGLNWESDVQPVFKKAETSNEDINITICELT